MHHKSDDINGIAGSNPVRCAIATSFVSKSLIGTLYAPIPPMISSFAYTVLSRELKLGEDMKIFAICFFSIFSLLVGTTHADNHAQMPAYGGVEVLACNYAEGKGINDLLRVSDKFDKWADKNFSKGYSGNVLTPFYFNKMEADVYWVGFSDSFADQGVVQGEWLEKGGEMRKEFNSVYSCNSRSQFGWIRIRDETGDTNTGVVDFSACKMSSEATQEKIAAADTQMNKFLSKIGSSVRIYRWFPMQGNAMNGMDLLQAMWNESLETKGVNSDKFIMNGGIQMRNALYGSLLQCSGGPSANYVLIGGSE